MAVDAAVAPVMMARMIRAVVMRHLGCATKRSPLPGLNMEYRASDGVFGLQRVSSANLIAVWNQRG